MKYTLDSNILINLSRVYPEDLFPTLWDNIKNESLAGKTCVCDAVKEELERGSDHLIEWVSKETNLVCSTTDEEQITVKEIAESYPDWVREDRNAADPFVIAHAKREGAVIVTEEKRAANNVSDRNQKIPNVAEEHGVECVKFFDYLKAKGWRF